MNEKQTPKGMFPIRGPYPPPTFSSSCIRRTYGLGLKAALECLGEEERFKIHWMGVKVLAAKMEPGTEEEIRGIEEAAAGIAVGKTSREGEGLPSYERTGEESLPRYEKHVDGKYVWIGRGVWSLVIEILVCSKENSETGPPFTFPLSPVTIYQTHPLSAARPN